MTGGRGEGEKNHPNPRSLNRPVLGSFFVVAVLAAILGLYKGDEAGPGIQVRSVELTYEVTVKNIGSVASRIYVWVPIPNQNMYQDMEGMTLGGEWTTEILEDKEFGNKYLRVDLSQRTMPAQDIQFEVRYRVKRRALRPIDRSLAQAGMGSAIDLERYLAPDSLVPIKGKLAREARRVQGGATEPLDVARRLYENLIHTMSYDKSGEGWGRGDAAYACDVRKGNCTDFHSLFIGQSRSLGIPARFVMGFPLPQERAEGFIAGYHCWAEFYVQNKGWMPLDVSEAHKHPEKKEALFGGLDAHRVQFTVGRDIRLPGAKAGPVNYSVYPHVEVDGQKYNDVDWRLKFRNI